MKKNIFYILAGLWLLLFFGCQKEDEVQQSIEREPITSIEASFTEGDYKLEVAPNAIFKTKITDPDITNIVIKVPWYYPEASDNMTSINRMRVRAELDNNCRIEPELTILDLTKENHFKLFLPNGTVRNIIITGEIYKLTSCNITYFSIEDAANEISVTGAIDDAKGTISLITPDDLSTVKVDLSISPHATIDKDVVNEVYNFNSPVEFTVTAQDGITKKTYTVKKEIPNKIGYGFTSGTETNLWSANPLDLGLSWGTGQTTLAAIGNYLIMSSGDGSTPIYLNRMTGAKLGTIVLGGASSTGSVANDNNDNLIISNTAQSGEKLNIYRTKSVKKAPTLYLSYQNSSGLPISRILVQGNLDGEAQIVATCDGIAGITNSSQVVRWIVSGGVPGAAQVVTFTGVQSWGGGATNTQVAPVSTNVLDGYFTGAYDSNVVYYVNGTNNAGTATVSDGSGNSWAMNQNRLDVRTFNNARYLAVGSTSHFPQWGIKGMVYLFDITSVGSLTGDVSNSSSLAFKTVLGSNLASGDGISANGDVLLVPSSNGFYLHLYYWDNNNKIVGAYSFNCIDK